MSASLGPENPIILFGDVGPDVCRLSQIYNPTRGKFIPSNDEAPVTGKTYYSRTYANKVVSFEPVGSLAPTTSPRAQGYYEDNPNFSGDTAGTYVPAVNSLVVVDVGTADFFEEGTEYKIYTLLMVEAVDDQIREVDGQTVYPTFRTTLRPFEFGTTIEESERTLDYGNDRYMVYFEEIQPGVFRLIPDRKLALYGRYTYEYRITRGLEQKVVSAPTLPLSQVTSDALIPYTGATSTAATLTTTDILGGAYANTTFAVIGAEGRRAITVPEIPQYPNNTYRQSLDITYKSGKTYHQLTTNGEGQVVYKQLVAGTDYNIGDPVGLLNGAYVDYTTILNAMYWTGNATTHTLVDDIFGASGVEGYILNEAGVSTVHFPEAGYFKSGVTPVVGETLTMEVFERKGDSRRLVLSINVIAKEGTAISGASGPAPRIVNFFVDAFDSNGDRVQTQDNDWLLGVGDDLTNWTFAPTLVYDDGSTETVELDGKNCFVYGLDNVVSANPGKVYPVFFKYFVAAAEGLDSNLVKRHVTFTKNVRIANTMDGQIKGISVIPVWNYGLSRYDFRYLIYRLGQTSAPEVLERLDQYVGTTRVGTSKTATYKDNGGSIRAITPSVVGTTFGFYQHIGITLEAAAPGFTTVVYNQNVAMRLQQWISNIEEKWLLGSYTESVALNSSTNTSDSATVVTPYTREETPYGNGDTDYRPYITYYPSQVEGVADKFMVGAKCCATYADFRRVFLENTGRYVGDPTHCRLRTFVSYPKYDALSSPTALKNVVYYSADGVKQPVIVGDTDVTQFTIKVQDNLRYYRINVDGSYSEATGLVVGNTIASADRSSLYILGALEVSSNLVKLPTEDSDNSMPSKVFTIDGDESTGARYWDKQNWSSTAAVGGIFPEVIGADRGAQVMGVCIMEFLKFLGSNRYEYLYGVPVEVRFPYSPTTDMEYQDHQDYYFYDETKHEFELDRGWTPGDQIPTSPVRFVPYGTGSSN